MPGGFRRNYRASSSWGNNRYDNPKVRLIFHWDNLSQAGYTLKFDNIGKNWDTVKGVIDLIKATIPDSQREYNPDTKEWFIGEKFFAHLKPVFESIPCFDCDIIEKPEQVTAQKFIPIEVDLERFKQLLSLAHIPYADTKELAIAKKLYRQAAMVFHPDRNPQMAETMSEFNEIWARLKNSYFDSKEKETFTNA